MALGAWTPKRWHAARKQRGMTLMEIMFASALMVTAIMTAIGAVTFYSKATHKADRVARLANLLEGQMERVLSHTWSQMASSTGIFPPGGPSSVGPARTAWPTVAGPFARYEAPSLRQTLVSGSTVGSSFTGLAGTLQVYYTPFTFRHEAITDAGVATRDVYYYKVEVVVLLDERSRIRPGSGPDEWAVVTYVSELSGRTATEFSQKIVGTDSGSLRIRN